MGIVRKFVSIGLIAALLVSNMGLSAFAESTEDGHTHEWVSKVVKATLEKDGYKMNVCESCGAEGERTIIYHPEITVENDVFIYNGMNQRPVFHINDSQGNPIDQKYYTLDYPDDSTSCGGYCIEVRFKALYSGVSNIYYSIHEQDISQIEIDLGSRGYLYTGEAIEPDVLVSWLREGEHYRISYENNVEIGTGTVLVEGIAPFTGTARKKFEIGMFSFVDNGYNTVTLMECASGAKGDVVVPDTYEGNTVTAIHRGAFSNCDLMTSVSLPDTITKIEKDAFYGCESLQQLDLPANLTTIDDRAFAYCTNLESVDIPDNVLAVGEYLFAGCSKLKDVSLSKAMTVIPAYMFMECESLELVTVPENLTEIEPFAFSGCSSMKKISLPDTVEKIGYHAFENCSSLYKMVLPLGLKEIEPGTFKNCTALTSVSVPDGLEKVGNRAFYQCKNIYSIKFPESLRSIGRYAFYGCEDLHYVTYPETAELQENCFYGSPFDPTSAATGKKDLFEEKYRIIFDDYDMTYNGKEKMPTAYVEWLIEGVDYQLHYEYNIDAGVGLIVAEGLGEYGGTIDKTFLIEPADIQDYCSKVSLSQEVFVYDGTAQKPKVLFSDMTEGQDYTVEFLNEGMTLGTTQLIIYGKGNYTGEIVLEYSINLATPVLSVSTQASTGKPVISWNEIDEAFGYELYKSTKKSGDYELLYVTTEWGKAVTSVVDEDAVPGTKYYYKVRALSREGYHDSAESDPVTTKRLRTKYSESTVGNSSFSKIKAITCDLPRPTVSISTVDASGKPKLTWKKVKGASKYVVYRAMYKNGTYHKLYTTTKNSYINTSAVVGKKYYYKVQAIYRSNSNANSARSLCRAITCDCARPSVTIKLSKAGKPKLSWKAVKGASKYEIWRATSKNGKYTKVYTTRKLNYTNTKAKKGKRYYYKVRAVCSVTKNGNSAFSLKKSIVTKK